jgi:hypothetical protein
VGRFVGPALVVPVLKAVRKVNGIKTALTQHYLGSGIQPLHAKEIMDKLEKLGKKAGETFKKLIANERPLAIVAVLIADTRSDLRAGLT